MSSDERESRDWPARARRVFPGGGFGNFDPGIVIAEGRGARVRDTEGRVYVDLLIGSGPMILGHDHPEVTGAVADQLARGTTFFANNPAGIALAEAIIAAVPSAEQVRYVSTGGEADMYAMRLARAATGREKILKFEGGYHGMSAEAQMSLAPGRFANFPQAVPDSAGIPEAVRRNVLVAPFNDIAAVRDILDEHEGEVAGIIVEPLQRIIPPAPGFLQALRAECDRRGIVLVFDEIVTGFRIAHGGAQQAWGVVPDVTTLGKVIGGGFALAAIAGRREIMAHFDKEAVGAERWLMQMGTLSGNPVAAVAGLRTVEILSREGQYARLHELGGRLMRMHADALEGRGVPHRIVGHETLFDVVFVDHDVTDYRTWHAHDRRLNAVWNATLRAEGVLKSPGKLYPSLALTEEDLAIVEAAIGRAADAVAEAARR